MIGRAAMLIRVRLACLIYPGRMVWVQHGHQATSGGFLSHEANGTLRCSKCSTPMRDWPKYDCVMSCGRLAAPRRFSVGPRRKR